MEKLFYVLYGWFDENESWSRDLEKRYMEENCYNYTRDRSSSHTARDKGCFERLATAIKSDYVKSYQDIGKKTMVDIFQYQHRRLRVGHVIKEF